MCPINFRKHTKYPVPLNYAYIRISAYHLNIIFVDVGRVRRHPLRNVFIEEKNILTILRTLIDVFVLFISL